MLAGIEYAARSSCFKTLPISERGNERPRGETGEIVGRSGLMMTGYYGRPEDTKALLWRDREGNVFFRSGDLGAFDQDGFLRIVGRKKDVVISGGFNIYASDLESVLLAAASGCPRGGRDRHPERGVGRDPVGGGGPA